MAALCTHGSTKTQPAAHHLPEQALLMLLSQPVLLHRESPAFQSSDVQFGISMAYPTVPCSFMTVSQPYRRAFDVILLTETRAAYIANVLFHDHQISCVPASRPGAPGEGIVVAVRKQHAYHVQDWAADEASVWVRIRFLCSQHPTSYRGVLCASFRLS